MSEQQSQKHGVKSSAQKEARARQDYEPQPASNKVAGAFGKENPEADTGNEKEEVDRT